MGLALSVRAPEAGSEERVSGVGGSIALRYSGDFVPRLKPNLDLNSVVIGAEDHFSVQSLGWLDDGAADCQSGWQVTDACRSGPAAPGGSWRYSGLMVRSNCPIAWSKSRQLLMKRASGDRQGSRKNFAKRINKVSEADLIGVGRFEGFMFPRGPLEEICALEINVRKEMLFLDARIEDMSPFKVIDLLLSADDGRIMRQADKKLRMFHPDTYFGQEVGSFGPIILRLYNKVREAADLLLDPEKRSELRTQLLGVCRRTWKRSCSGSTRSPSKRTRAHLRWVEASLVFKKNPMFAEHTSSENALSGGDEVRRK